MLNAAKLLRWYDRHHRALPWRRANVDPYHIFISEAMLQQTQIATVVPYFKRFTQEYPTIQALAKADEQSVLRLWQGLGYYSRARNLLAAAKQIVQRFGGEIPADVTLLQSLPGIGQYTAGAIASIAYDRRAPILDGNVARVLCRVERIESDPRDAATRRLLWKRAEEVLPPRRPGAFNQAMMDLGATICTPRNPKCAICPLRNGCRAFAAGVQEQIPLARAKKPSPKHRRWTFCIQRASDDRWLIEQRPAAGRWANLWQFVTIDAASRSQPTAQTVHSTLRIKSGPPARLGKLHHALSHRKYEFDVYHCTTNGGKNVSKNQLRKWVRLSELHQFPLPRPHLKIAEILRLAAPARESYIRTGERARFALMLGTKAQSPQQIEEQIDGELDEAFHAAKSEKAKTSTVIVFLVLASMIFSYLIAYCLINALVAAEIMTRWPVNRDPRPKIFGAALIVSLSALGALAAFARSISRRQLNRIDEMQEG